MATSIYASTPETTNSNRASRILLGPCTDQLRDVLRHRVPPANFHHVLTRNRSSLPRLTQPQRDLILPRSGRYSGDYSDMDISFLYLLLRNICNIPAHTNGWGNTPDVSDSSLSASIDRIREARNGVVHSSSTSVTQTEFNNLLHEIKIAVIAMDSLLGNSNKYEKEVDFLLTETMDPEQDVFIQQLKKQVEEEKITKEIVTKLDKQVHEDISTINEGVEELYTRVGTLERGGERLERGVEKLDRGVQKNKRDIEDIREVIEKQSVQDVDKFKVRGSSLCLSNRDVKWGILRSCCDDVRRVPLATSAYVMFVCGTYSLPLMNNLSFTKFTLLFFFFSSFITGYRALWRCSISGGNCSCTKKFDP
ncbi:hypothetical protein FSP39_005720 [Pinctada imbricata]|uniref:DZIP3-like HEPN domain-containing protein n=1 Tax=Pinctada imbricata TaxID=66713 RepID=A0AA88YKV2_PINIB|nr:hypothetical protein FSP39_005720 [Pinctada imbricata]